MLILEFLFFIFVFGFTFSVAAEQNTCSLKQKDGNADISEICQQLNNQNSNYCNQKIPPAKKVNFATGSYGIFGASSKMKDLFQKLEKAQSDFIKTSEDCPAGCKKVPQPTAEIQTQPTDFTPNSECPSSYQAIQLDKATLSLHQVKQSKEAFQKTFQLQGDQKVCQKAATDYAQDTLMGKNKLGSLLESVHCPSPCSYSSVIKLKLASEEAGTCQTDLELTVLCGPPKKDSEWKTQATLTTSFSCEVNK